MPGLGDRSAQSVNIETNGGRVDFVCSIRCPRTTFARARAGIMDMRGKRAARAYRNFVVESTWDRHMQTLLLAAVACAVSLASMTITAAAAAPVLKSTSVATREKCE